MKGLLFLVMLLPAFAIAQKATMTGDTLFYQGKKVTVGDTVSLGYGSKPNKDFAFVYIGTAMGGMDPLSSARYKLSMVVIKVYKSYGKLLFRAKPIEAGPMYGMKVVVDLEGAVDNKELILN